MTPWLLDFEKVTVVRGGRTALALPRLQIRVGESVLILGPNGSGKSTLIKAVNRECYPKQVPGLRFRIMDQDVWNVFEMRRWLGIVSNELQATYARDVTGEAVVLSGYFSSIGLWPDHVVSPAMRRRARSLLRWLEVPHLATRSMTQMSSGEARRLLIGRALVQEPKALLLDEPSTSLDLHAAHAVRGLLSKIARSGTAVLLVTHHVDDVIPEIRRVVCLRDGRLWKEGPVTRVLKSSTLSTLFRTRLQVVRRGSFYHAW